MGRKRKGAGVVELPIGVQAVKRGERVYYYWHPGRGTERGKGLKPIALGKDPRHADFWKKIAQLTGAPIPGAAAKGTWAALDREWRGDEKESIAPSREWVSLSDGTRRIYALRMKRIVRDWGKLQVSLTDLEGVTALRDTFSGPVAANQMVGVIRAAMAWGRRHGYPSKDPTTDLEAVDVGEVDGATPWPEWAYEIVRKEAPEPLRRAAFLGRATGQRRSDLVRMGKRSRRDDGLEFQIKKLRNRVHFIPLLKGELAEIDGWATSDIGPYITTSRGRPTNGGALADALKAFCLSHPALKETEVFLHGLRALAVCDRRIQGMTHQEISGQICMSIGMVMRYSKRIDTEILGRAANVRREQSAP